ncbi:hypothetical protein ACMFMG_003983 [Clarireedia jacksonii]
MAPEQKKQARANKGRSRRDGKQQPSNNNQQIQVRPSESIVVHYADPTCDMVDGSQNAASPHSYNGTHTPVHEHLPCSAFDVNYRAYQDHQHDLQGMGSQFATPIYDNPQSSTQEDQQVSYSEQTAVLSPSYDLTQHEHTTHNTGMTSAQNNVVVSCGSEGSHYSIVRGCWCSELE